MSSSTPFSSLETLFAWDWQSSLAGAMAIALVGLLQVACRRWLPARVAYLLWSCALLRLMLPMIPASQFSLLNLLPRGGSALAWHAAPTRKEPQPVGLGPLQAAGEVVPVEPSLIRNQVKPAVASSSPELGWDALSLAPRLWLLGAVIFLAAVFAKHRKLSAFLAQQKPIAHEKLQDCIAEGTRLFHLKQHIRAFEMRNEQAPAIFGFFRPRLLISKSVLDQLSVGELRLLVLHELAHVARRDVFLNWLTIFLQALHWFNPAVWLAIRQWRAAREGVCDARILSLLNTGERHTYGAMLLKIASQCLKPSSPGLVPIFKTKKEIHRRITMIARFKPTTRIAALASVIILGLAALVTLTGAGEKPAQNPPERAPATPAAAVSATASTSSRTSEERLAILKRALLEENDRLEVRQREINNARTQLGIIDDDAKQQSETASMLLRKLETLKAEANAEYFQTSSLLKQLTSMSRAELRNAAPVVTPDEHLLALMQSYATTQQKLAELSAVYAAEHPEVKRVKGLQATIEKQINERLDGTLAGLRARADAAMAKLENLEAEYKKASKLAMEKAIAARPYYDRKRDLESQIALRDRLQVRLQEEQINALLQEK
jgi:beta-lactamase regulating signal transducer with metallopeptidase domain